MNVLIERVISAHDPNGCSEQFVKVHSQPITMELQPTVAHSV